MGVDSRFQKHWNSGNYRKHVHGLGGKKSRVIDHSKLNSLSFEGEEGLMWKSFGETNSKAP